MIVKYYSSLSRKCIVYNMTQNIIREWEAFEPKKRFGVRTGLLVFFFPQSLFPIPYLGGSMHATQKKDPGGNSLYRSMGTVFSL
jgi:hypothetical protein